MKPNKPNAQEKRSTLETLHTLWVPMAVGAVLLVMLAIVANLVWKDYSTALMDSQTRQMELVVQSLADSIEFSLEEYLDRLDSAVAKVEANPDDKPTVAPSDTLRDLWLEDNDGSIVYRCYGITALSDVLITRSEGVSYWQYHRGDTHYLVLKKAAGEQSVCLVVDSTTLYKQLVSDIRVGTNGYVMIKNANDMVVMHPESAQWGIQVVDGRQKLYAYKDLDLTSLSELLKAQRTQDSGIRDYYSYWWTDPKLPRVHKISAFRHLDVGSSFWIVSAVVDYDDLYQPVRDSFLKMALMFSAVAVVLVLFAGMIFRLQWKNQRSVTKINDLQEVNEALEELQKSRESLAHDQRLQLMGTLTGGIAHEFNNFLTPITGYADLIMADADPEDEPALDKVIQAADADYRHDVISGGDVARADWRNAAAYEWRRLMLEPHAPTDPVSDVSALAVIAVSMRYAPDATRAMIATDVLGPDLPTMGGLRDIIGTPERDVPVDTLITDLVGQWPDATPDRDTLIDRDHAAWRILSPIQQNAPAPVEGHIYGLLGMLDHVEYLGRTGETGRMHAERALRFDPSDRFASAVLDTAPTADGSTGLAELADIAQDRGTIR